jgi:hypothetical protein
MQRFVATKKTVEGIAVGNSSCLDGSRRDSSNTGLKTWNYLILKRKKHFQRV